MPEKSETTGKQAHYTVASPTFTFASGRRTLRFYAACGAIATLILLFTSTGHVSNPAVNSFRSYFQDATNRTLGFERIFVLGMPERHDKRDAMSLAASLTGFQFDWMPGVDGSTVTAKAKPPMLDRVLLNDKSLGCWRAHMNAVQRMVKENIQTALILEDDADWDVNLKQLVRNLAQGSRYLHESEDRATYMRGSEDWVHNSPYGDDWDLLWLGHCGLHQKKGKSARYWITPNDPTAIPPEHFEFKQIPPVHIPALNAPFTRLVFRPGSGNCASGYALSLRGARKLLHQETQTLVPASPADIALRRLCNDKPGWGTMAKCIGVWPALFNGHEPRGPLNKASDRVEYGNETWRDVGVTKHQVFSTRLNFEALLQPRGDSRRVFKSQWPNHTMLEEYTGELKLPQGHGIEVPLP